MFFHGLLGRQAILTMAHVKLEKGGSKHRKTVSKLDKQLTLILVCGRRMTEDRVLILRALVADDKLPCLAQNEA